MQVVIIKMIERKKWVKNNGFVFAKRVFKKGGGYKVCGARPPKISRSVPRSNFKISSHPVEVKQRSDGA